jgi:putative transposase
MTSFIDEHRGDYGVEPICRVLPIAPSTYHERVAQPRDPSRLSPRAQRDEAMKGEVRRVFEANFKVYGVRRCGGRCGAKASTLPAARWNG